MYLYKFLCLKDGKIVSNHDKKTEWKIGEWKKLEGEIKCCVNGFHASKRIVDAHSYTQEEILTKVEVRGKSHKMKDKQAWSEMRIVKAWKWKKEDSVKKAVFSARLVLPIWKKYNKTDDRVEKAIEAAEAWLKNPSVKTMNSAAYASASAAYAASAAANAAAATDAAKNKIEKWHIGHLKKMESYDHAR